MEGLEGWVHEKVKTLSRHAETAKTFNCALNQWGALCRFLENGRMEIDNNLAKSSAKWASR